MSNYPNFRNELRLGNFYEWRIDTDHPWQVVQMKVVEPIRVMQSQPELYRPVELTEDWLERFGFVYDNLLDGLTHNTWLCVDDGLVHVNFDAYRGLPSKLNWMEIPARLKFVHQLQNLYFALTGKELMVTE